MTTPALACRAVTRMYAPDAGVRGVDLDVRAGEIHAVVGLNGAGKSTLMRLALGMLEPSSGEVRLFGRLLPDLAPRDWAAVGHLLDRGLLYPELSVRQNLLLNARLRGWPAADAPDLAAAAIADLDLEPYAGRAARRLSQGNRQRAALAAALQHHPALLVLDEPTNALDPAGVVLLRRLLLDRRAAGAATLVSSHHLDEVARVADRITVVHDGTVVGVLPPQTPDIERAFFSLVLAHAGARR